jgi:folate-dependent phosphoribosylglycinamide formyltransferase PurN
METGAGSWDTMAGVRTEPLVIFGDRNVGFCGRLLEAFPGELRSRGDVELVAVFDTARRAPPGRLWRWAHGALRSAARFTFNPKRWPPRSGGFRQFDAVAQQHGIRPVVPAERNINHPRFVAMLRQQYRPTLAVSLGCLQIFQRELLASFEMAVNFHDGYLPSYQGWRATAWSLYNREAYSGYAWHVMEEGIDTGPILQRGRVAVTPGEAPRPVLSRKLALAARDVGRILDLMVQRAPGARNGAASAGWATWGRSLPARSCTGCTRSNFSRSSWAASSMKSPRCGRGPDPRGSHSPPAMARCSRRGAACSCRCGSTGSIGK